MKTKTIYIAFDNTEFTSAQDCLDYEANGYKSEIEKVEKRMQQLKGGILAEEYKMYKKALDKYRFVCNHRVSDLERSTAQSTFISIKARYEKTVLHYFQTKKRYYFLRNLAAKKD